MAEAAAVALAPTALETAKAAGYKADVELRRAWRKAKWNELTAFNYEKVFWRVVWSEGLLLIGKLALDIYQGIKVAEFKLRHPELAWDDLLVMLPIGPFVGGVGWALNAIPQWREWKAAQDAEEQLLLEKEVESDPVFMAGYYLDKYYLLAVLGVMLLFIFLEDRDCKRIKKLRSRE